MNLSMQTVRPRKKGCPCTCQRVDGRKPNCTPVYAIPFISEACQSTPAWWFQAMQYNMFVDLGGPLMLNFDTYPFAICCFCSHIQPISSLSSRGESPFLARIPSLLLESSSIQKNLVPILSYPPNPDDHSRIRNKPFQDPPVALNLPRCFPLTIQPFKHLFESDVPTFSH